MSRLVVITGSSGFLGKALRATFESQGDRVVGVDLHDAEWVCDLENDCPITLEPDILIANAKLKDWKSHQKLAEQTKIAIINIASIYATLGPDPALYEGTEVEPTPAWYAAAKGAMIALTKHQATTLAPVRSNCIILGGIFRGHSDLFRERYEAKVPLGRMATEQDAVNAVMFLASEKASYITGSLLYVDGGISARV